MVALVVLAVLLALYLRRRRRKGRRAFSADVLSDVLGVTQPYKGPRWRVRDRWL